MAEQNVAVTAWVLAGGEGRRMQGQDKGLMPYRGAPLAAWVLGRVAPQAGHLGIVANRNMGAYQNLLDAVCTESKGVSNCGVIADDVAWPRRSGPMAGILTALKNSLTEWVLVVPCDTPFLPFDLLAKLMQAALSEQVDVVVPLTEEVGQQARHHWVSMLLHQRASTCMSAAFSAGEHKVRQNAKFCKWTSVFFTEHTAFENKNDLETLHRDD